MRNAAFPVEGKKQDRAGEHCQIEKDGKRKTDKPNKHRYKYLFHTNNIIKYNGIVVKNRDEVKINRDKSVFYRNIIQQNRPYHVLTIFCLRDTISMV